MTKVKQQKVGALRTFEVSGNIVTIGCTNLLSKRQPFPFQLEEHVKLASGLTCQRIYSTDDEQARDKWYSQYNQARADKFVQAITNLFS
jgi:hypothetical protein